MEIIMTNKLMKDGMGENVNKTETNERRYLLIANLKKQKLLYTSQNKMTVVEDLHLS